MRVVISQGQKMGKYGKELGEKSGKLLTKSGKIRTFTKSVLTLHPPLSRPLVFCIDGLLYESESLRWTNFGWCGSSR